MAEGFDIERDGNRESLNKFKHGIRKEQLEEKHKKLFDIFDTNQNRLKNFKTGSKVDAKKRMKVLLNSERELTRSTENC